MRDHLAAHMDIAPNWTYSDHFNGVPCLIMKVQTVPGMVGQPLIDACAEIMEVPATEKVTAASKAISALISATRAPHDLLQKMDRAIARLEEHTVDPEAPKPEEPKEDPKPEEVPSGALPYVTYGPITWVEGSEKPGVLVPCSG